MKFKTLSQCLAVMFLFGSFGLEATFAQNASTGEIRGTVTDSSGLFCPAQK